VDQRHEKHLGGAAELHEDLPYETNKQTTTLVLYCIVCWLLSCVVLERACDVMWWMMILLFVIGRKVIMWKQVDMYDFALHPIRHGFGVWYGPLLNGWTKTIQTNFSFFFFGCSTNCHCSCQCNHMFRQTFFLHN
jgi:hypothetical protein